MSWAQSFQAEWRPREKPGDIAICQMLQSLLRFLLLWQRLAVSIGKSMLVLVAADRLCFIISVLGHIPALLCPPIFASVKLCLCHSCDKQNCTAEHLSVNHEEVGNTIMCSDNPLDTAEVTEDHNTPVFEVGFNRLKSHTFKGTHSSQKSRHVYPKPLREDMPAEGLGSQKIQHIGKHLTSGRGK